MKMNIAKTALVISGLLVAVTPFATHAQTTAGGVAVAPGSAMAVNTVKATATIVAIESASRVVTLKRPDGQVFSITAPPEMTRFDQLNVGDKVTVEFVRALSLDLKKDGSGIAASSQKEGLTRSPDGKPGGVVGRQVTVLANVIAVDTKKQIVTLKGPQGNVVDLNVQDPAQLKNIKKGDQIQAVYTEAMAISVEPVAKAAAK